jgi:hypothetical protein
LWVKVGRGPRDADWAFLRARAQAAVERPEADAQSGEHATDARMARARCPSSVFGQWRPSATFATRPAAPPNPTSRLDSGARSYRAKDDEQERKREERSVRETAESLNREVG